MAFNQSQQLEITQLNGALPDEIQAALSAGFAEHTQSLVAPDYNPESVNWVHYKQGEVIAVLTAKRLWDWLYIDELWVDKKHRGQGLAQQLMAVAQEHAKQTKLTGLWLWTQSWQAEGFYLKLGFEVFARFSDFPKGHSRIGFRKYLVLPNSGLGLSSPL